jgi:hypothetical protein
LAPPQASRVKTPFAMISKTHNALFFCLALLPALFLATGCGTMIRKAAINNMSGMMRTDAPGNVYTSDDDPELIRAALPFALKTLEMFVKEDPGNPSLRVAAASGFVQYANAFVEGDATGRSASFEQAQTAKLRAARLYLRGRDYALDGLELAYPGFKKELRTNAKGAAAKLAKKDAPLAFWAGAGWAAAIPCNPSDMALVGELPYAEAIMRRVLELDENYGAGSVHEFFIRFEGSRSEMMGGSPERAKQHFERAVDLSGGLKASPYVAMAETVAVKKQDAAMFKDLLGKALAIDVNAAPDWRLANVLAQDQARRLLARGPELFLDYEETKP